MTKTGLVLWLSLKPVPDKWRAFVDRTPSFSVFFIGPERGLLRAEYNHQIES